MEYIELGYGYRLHRRDSANWGLQEFRKPSNKGFAKNMEDRSPKWCDCGKFYQSLSTALLAVYGLVLRKDEEGAFQIMRALVRMVFIDGMGYSDYQFTNTKRFMQQQVTMALDNNPEWKRLERVRVAGYGISRAWELCDPTT